jgi:hypothetical protein
MRLADPRRGATLHRADFYRLSIIDLRGSPDENEVPQG